MPSQILVMRAERTSWLTDTVWLDAARRHFTGTVIVGRDLLEV